VAVAPPAPEAPLPDALEVWEDDDREPLLEQAAMAMTASEGAKRARRT
jgi:hypothetical protein